MPKIVAKDGESFNVTLKKFKKACERSGLLSDIKKNKFYEKPNIKRRRKIKEAKRKRIKLLRKRHRYNR